MTWDLYLYPEILEITWNLRWRWTILRWLLCLSLLWKFRPRKVIDTIPSPAKETFLPEQYQQQLKDLASKIWSESTQDRYSQYQQLLREIVQKKYGIDISSMTLKSLKYSHTWLKKSLVNLLEQSYYYPYNLEAGQHDVMQEEIQSVSNILLD